MDLHVFPIPIPPPASLSIPSLWVFPVHQPWAPVSCDAQLCGEWGIQDEELHGIVMSNSQVDDNDYWVKNTEKKI